MPARMLTYRWFAREYGWTPAQVNGLPLDTVGWFARIEDAAARAAKLKGRGKGGR
jgi:hypothetical protein